MGAKVMADNIKENQRIKIVEEHFNHFKEIADDALKENTPAGLFFASHFLTQRIGKYREDIFKERIDELYNFMRLCVSQLKDASMVFAIKENGG